MKKQYFAVVDSETTINDRVADFGIVICDRNGNIMKQAGILVHGIFQNEPLFYNKDSNSIWSESSVQRRTESYVNMLNTGTRMLASVNAINRWINQAIQKYNPILTAFNLAFDASKCQNTGIDLSGFSDKFCLWHAAAGNICATKKYRQFVLNNHLFNTPTKLGNMTFRTDAEAVSGYLRGGMIDEPHTSIEDIIGFELPILSAILKKKGWKNKMVPYDWKKFQVKNHFKV